MITPQFSYPGGIWLQKGCDVKHYTLLLDFILFENVSTPAFVYERQSGGNLIRFDNAGLGLNCFNYVTNI